MARLENKFSLTPLASSLCIVFPGCCQRQDAPLKGHNMADRCLDLFIRNLYPATLAVVLVMLMLPGCYPQQVSIGGMAADTGWRSEQKVAHSNFEGNGLTLDVSSSNVSGSHAMGKSEFALSVRFYFNETNFQFDPRQVRLALSDASEVAPQRIEMAASTSGGSNWECASGIRQWYFSRSQGLAFSYVKEGRVERTERMLSLGSEACFEFYFPVSPPSPDTPFALRIRGLAREGQPVEIPEVQFKKGSFWIWDFLGR